MIEIEIGIRLLTAIAVGAAGWLVNRWWAYRARRRGM